MGAFAAVKSGLGSVKSSMAQLASLNIDLMEKVAEKQMASAGYYTEVGFSQLKGAKAIGSVADAKAFSSKSLEVGSASLKKMVADSKEMVGLGSTYKDELVSIVKSMKSK